MARAGLPKGVSFKNIRVPTEESGNSEGEEEDLEPNGEFERFFGMFLWTVVWIMISFSGYYMTGDCRTSKTNPMWKSNIFSEYVPPARVHTALFESRKTFLSLAYHSNNASATMANLWDPPPHNGWRPCSEPPESNSLVPVHNGYLQVFCSGGLFQLHICVCNAVAAAKMLNATLLVPYFREGNVWKDPSQFHDIYDVDHFMTYLKEDVSVVKVLPRAYEWSVPELYNANCEAHPNCVPFPPKHASLEWYMTTVLPILRRFGIVTIERYNHKLSFEGLPPNIVDNRCRSNFHALKFVNPIANLSEILVDRLRAKAPTLEGTSPIVVASDLTLAKEPRHWWEFLMGGLGKRRRLVTIQRLTTEGRFVGLHVRFEKDMVAHSACYYDGGLAEKRALAAYRKVFFRSGVAKARFDPSYLRKNGSCPLTPEEMGLLLAGLGFSNNTIVYTAGKSVYGANARLQPFKDLFPLVENKESLATGQELKRFLPHAHQLAALDFLVLRSSNVFMSNAAGNFPNVLTGHRTYFGPKKSIHPDKAFVASLFRKKSLTWPEFSSQVIGAHNMRLGGVVQRRRRYSVFRYPAPDCMCQT